jgi:hypothetical protein
MKQIFIILFLIFLVFLNANVYENLSYDEIIEICKTDSLHIEEINNAIIKKFPSSEKTWDLAHNEFYDRLYPVWGNARKQIPLLDSLLIKYPSTTFKRTIYLYQLYNLNKIGSEDSLMIILNSYRKDFPKDYQSFYLSGVYSNEDNSVLESYLKTALKLAKSDWKPKFYPQEQWLLEHRAASKKCTESLSKILMERDANQEAIDIIDNELSAKKLGVNDEETYIGCYYLKAKNLHTLGETDKAIDACIDALIEGDSRNRYISEADSLLRKLLEPKNLEESEIMDFVRDKKNYKGPIFTNVTNEMGLSEVIAGRVAWADYDNDGFDDLLLNGSRLFHNENGENFLEITSSVFTDTLRGNGAIWADMNNDGLLDIVTKDPEALWLQEEYSFEKSANAIIDNGVSTEGMGIADFDGDGFLDIYYANYQSANYVNNNDELWKNNGDGTFEQAIESFGLLPKDKIPRAGRGVNACDFDLDGDIDIYVSNYRLQENFFFINNGNGKFSNKAREFGVAGEEIEGWWGHTIGSEWGDYDCDGDFDLITANLAHPRYIDFSNKTKLYENKNGIFVDRREFSGIKFNETQSEPCWADFDNDGYLDLLITCVYENHPSVLYHNNQDGTFTDISYLAGVRHLNGWGVACTDFDNNGTIDILLSGGEVQLFNNVTQNDNNWITLNIKGRSHIDGIGTKILYIANDKKMIREIQGGKGTSNQHSLQQHFGFGTTEPPYKFKINYQSNKWQKIEIKQKNKIISLP